MNKNAKPTNPKIYLAVALFFIVIVAALFISGKNNMQKQNLNVEPNKTNEKADTTDLNLSVGRNTDNLTIINNESAELKNCEVRINPSAFNTGYTYNYSFPAKEEVQIPLSSFTRNDEIFDNTKTQVKTVTVAICENNKFRRASFTY